MFYQQLFSATDLESWIKNGKFSGNARYYYIKTINDNNSQKTSSYANAIGANVKYQTSSLHGLKLSTSLMGTTPIELPQNIDSSILGKYNGVRSGIKSNERDGFIVLGEAYADYTNNFFDVWYGAREYKTPLINIKDVRMLPSTVQGGEITLKPHNTTTFSLGYLHKFKQRTSSSYVNILKHALGDDTKIITGSERGYILPVGLHVKIDKFSFRLYDYYADEFLNSIYFDAHVKSKINSKNKYSLGFQYLNQKSIGSADDYFKANPLYAGGSAIKAQAYGVKASYTFHDSTFGIAYSNVKNNSNYHDSLVLPWDGTPLFTNTLTSSNLFQSLYAKGLRSDSIYIGGSKGIKLSYAQKYNFTGLKGFSTKLFYLRVKNDEFTKQQQDINAIVTYKLNDFSISLRGIWVKEKSSASKDEIITQTDNFSQYRIIVNYYF